MTTQNEERDGIQSSAYNPFPEPQTIPSGWDTSGFYSVSESASAVDEQDAAES